MQEYTGQPPRLCRYRDMSGSIAGGDIMGPDTSSVLDRPLSFEYCSVPSCVVLPCALRSV